MITFVVHWVHEPALEGKNHGIPVLRMLDLLKQSAERFNDCRFVFLTDQGTQAPLDWDVVRVKRRDRNVMGHMMLSREKACPGLDGDVVFCDADTLVAKPLGELFRGDWSICVPWFPRYYAGVILCRDIPFAKHFFARAHDLIRDMEPCHQLFGGDQETMKSMISTDDGGVKKEQASLICETPPDELRGYSKWSPSGYLVNFKGVRKRYMEAAFCKL